MEGISLLVGLLALFFFFYSENIRRPAIKFLPDRDKIDTDSDKFFYHVWVQNAMPKGPFNRDIAVGCTAKVEFLDQQEFLNRGGEVRLEPPGQITTKWEAQPDPVFRDPDLGTFFDPEKVALAQRKDVGFSPEKLDVVVKFRNDPDIYATDTWKLYEKGRSPNLRLPASECVLKIEVAGINTGKPHFGYYMLSNSGPGPGGVVLTRINKPRIGQSAAEGRVQDSQSAFERAKASLMAIISLAGFLLGTVGMIRYWRTPLAPHDIAEVGEAFGHNELAASGAAISIAVLLLFLTLGLQRKEEPPKARKRLEQTVVALLTTAFFGFIVSSVLFSITGSLPVPPKPYMRLTLYDRLGHDVDQIARFIDLSFGISATSHYLAIILILLTLIPLLTLSGYSSAKRIVAWVVSMAIVIGYLFAASALTTAGLSKSLLFPAGLLSWSIASLSVLLTQGFPSLGAVYLRIIIGVTTLVPLACSAVFIFGFFEPRLFLAAGKILTIALLMLTVAALVGTFKSVSSLKANN